MDPQLPQGVQPPKRPPIYTVGKEGHYGACQQLVSNGQASNPDLYTGPWTNINQGLTDTYREVLATYWQAQLRHLEDADHDYKMHQLPLARIKKVMKADPEVKMISAEAPILFAKGCDIFITELTMRAWIHAEENKRRTLQRSDIAAALAKSDMFDFLIDIVPRDESGQSSKRPGAHGGGSAAVAGAPQAPQPAAPMQQQPHMAQHHPDYPAFHQHMPPDQEFRPPPQQMYVPHGQPDPAYQQPPGMFDRGLYGGYPMPAQQMYQMPQRGQEQDGGPETGHHQYRGHEGGEGEADAEGERDYEVG